MTTQHTPNDWIAHGTTIAHESPGGVEYTIASFAESKLPLEEQLANARLGAAAPRLLKALEGLLPIVRYAAKCTCPDSQMGRCSYCRRQDARAAIAEATAEGE